MNLKFQKNNFLFIRLFIIFLNKYIIDTLPKIFEIINKINKQKNFKLSHSVRNLIGTIGNPKRNINYDFFEENQENLQQQNISLY